MAVHPAHQRCGYGDHILTELENRADNRGFNRLVLETFDRLTAAQRFYEKHGYEETSRQCDDEFGEDRTYYRKLF